MGDYLSTKVFVGIVVSILGTIVVIVNDLQEAGWEAPSWIMLATTVISGVVMWWVRETNPSPSAVDTITRRQAMANPPE